MISPWYPALFQAHLQLGARSSQQAAGQLQFSEQMQMQRTGHFFRHAILLKMLGKCWGNSENFWGMFLTSPEMCRNHQSCCDPNMDIAEITRETVIKMLKDVERCWNSQINSWPISSFLCKPDLAISCDRHGGNSCRNRSVGGHSSAIGAHGALMGPSPSMSRKRLICWT